MPENRPKAPLYLFVGTVQHGRNFAAERGLDADHVIFAIRGEQSVRGVNRPIIIAAQHGHRWRRQESSAVEAARHVNAALGVETFEISA